MSGRRRVQVHASRSAYTRLVGQVHSVQEVADEFGVSWEVAMKAVIEFGEPLVEDEDRVGEVDELGVDETSFLKAKPDQRSSSQPGWWISGRGG